MAIHSSNENWIFGFAGLTAGGGILLRVVLVFGFVLGFQNL